MFSSYSICVSVLSFEKEGDAFFVDVSVLRAFSVPFVSFCCYIVVCKASLVAMAFIHS